MLEKKSQVGGGGAAAVVKFKSQKCDHFLLIHSQEIVTSVPMDQGLLDNNVVLYINSRKGLLQ